MGGFVVKWEPRFKTAQLDLSLKKCCFNSRHVYEHLVVF